MNRKTLRSLVVALFALSLLTVGVLAQPAGRSGRPDHCGPDLAAAAETLGIAEDALKDALGDPQAGPPNFAEAAETLGISEDALIEALGKPPAGREGGREGEKMDRPKLDLAAAAEALGVTEDALKEALGEPGSPIDFESAAETLGVTVEQLMEALGIPEGGQNGRPARSGQQGGGQGQHRPPREP